MHILIDDLERFWWYFAAAIGGSRLPGSLVASLDVTLYPCNHFSGARASVSPQAQRNAIEATSSLGISTWFGNTEFSVYGVDLKRLQAIQFQWVGFRAILMEPFWSQAS